MSRVIGIPDNATVREIVSHIVLHGAPDLILNVTIAGGHFFRGGVRTELNQSSGRVIYSLFIKARRCAASRRR